MLLAGVSDEEKAKELKDIPKPVLQVIEKLMDQGKSDAQVPVVLTLFPSSLRVHKHTRSLVRFRLPCHVSAPSPPCFPRYLTRIPSRQIIANYQMQEFIEGNDVCPKGFENAEEKVLVARPRTHTTTNEPS